MSERNYQDLGLKVGLEIHQQLDTKKLFCDCNSDLVEESGKEVTRKLRPTASELGEIDPAALLEAQKKLTFRYQCPEKSSCLVELDEEPPEGPDEEAMNISLKMALMLSSDIADEIDFMRKIVIDGSNTTGFQRTGLIAMNGTLDMDDKEIRIQTICLEEDAARSVEKGSDEKVYRLDRLGIPLIEIATDPDIRSPSEAKEVAQKLGGLLRATRQVKRGLGTIREDLNVSIEDGARIEIKGVQELDMLPEYVENEIDRQMMLLDISEKLKEGGAEVDHSIENLDNIFEDTESGLIKSNLNSGKSVYGAKLDGFDGTLRGEKGEALLGPEMAEYAKKTGVAGIFHSDELPKYGITEEEVQQIEDELGVEDEDAFVLVVENKENAEQALEKVFERCEMALDGVPEETRNAQMDGTTTFSRPLSGEARMYPETDIPPVSIDKKRLEELEENLPERPSKRIERFQDDYDLNEQQSEQLFRKGYDILFEDIVTEHGHPAVASDMFLQTFSKLEDEGYEPKTIDEKDLKEVFRRLDKGEFAKEGIEKLLKELSEGKTVEEGIDSADLGSVDDSRIRDIVENILDDREDFIEERGMSAVGPLMGVVMDDLRGKADGEKVSRILREELQKRLG